MSQTSIDNAEKKTLLLSTDESNRDESQREDSNKDSQISHCSTLSRPQRMVKLAELKEAVESLEKQILIQRSDLNPLFKNFQSPENHNELIMRHLTRCMEDIKVLRGNYFHYNILLRNKSDGTEQILKDQAQQQHEIENSLNQKSVRLSQLKLDIENANKKGFLKSFKNLFNIS